MTFQVSAQLPIFFILKENILQMTQYCHQINFFSCIHFMETTSVPCVNMIFIWEASQRFCSIFFYF